MSKADKLVIPGTSKVVVPKRRRLLVATDGLPKTGKTRFALTAPKDLLWVNTDESGEEGVMELLNVPGVHPLDAVLTESDKHGKGQSKAADIVAKFRAAYFPFLSKLRTVVIDSWSDFVDLGLVATKGSVDNSLFARPEVYKWMREIVRAAAREGVNLILTHRLKDEWKDVPDPKNPGKTVGIKVGIMSARVGFAETKYMVHVNGRHWKSADLKVKSPDKFNFTIEDCRQNTDIEGETLNGSMCDFPTLGMMVFPDSEEEDWV